VDLLRRSIALAKRIAAVEKRAATGRKPFEDKDHVCYTPEGTEPIRKPTLFAVLK